MAAKKNSAVVSVRSRATIALAPATLGFNSLVEPDTYDPANPAFKVDLHFNPAAIELLRKIIANKCYSEANLTKLRQQAEENGIKWRDPQDPKEWLEAKLKEPKDNAPVHLPKLVVATKANFKNRQGEVIRKDMVAWDRENNLLDLKSLKLGRGSVVEAIVHPNVFLSKLIGFPQPKLDLAGVRILKLTRYGGTQAPEETDPDEIASVLGDLELDEDLTLYAVGVHQPSAPGEAGSEADGGPVF